MGFATRNIHLLNLKCILHTSKERKESLNLQALALKKCYYSTKIIFCLYLTNIC